MPVAYDSLTAAERTMYAETVEGSHNRRVTLEVTNRNGWKVTSLPGAFLGGSIQVDDSQTPAISLDGTVLDLDGALLWEQGEHRRHNVRVIDARFVPGLDGGNGEWVETVEFEGPIRRPARTGPVVTLTGQSIERQAMGDVRKPYNAPAKSRATRVLRSLLQAAGASSSELAIPNLKRTLPSRTLVGIKPKSAKRDKNDKGKDDRKIKVFKVDDTYWAEASKIASALGRDLIPVPGRGIALVNRGGKPVKALQHRHLVAVPEERPGGDEDMPNRWVVIGKKPKGKRKRPKASASLPGWHAASAQSQAWHNKPYVITETVENNQIRTKKAARREAKQLRKKGMSQSTGYSVSCLPCIPGLRIGQRVSFPTASGRGTLLVRQWTLPLGPGADPMTLGFNDRESAAGFRAANPKGNRGNKGKRGGKRGGR